MGRAHLWNYSDLANIIIIFHQGGVRGRGTHHQNTEVDYECAEEDICLMKGSCMPHGPTVSRSSARYFGSKPRDPGIPFTVPRYPPQAPHRILPASSHPGETWGARYLDSGTIIRFLSVAYFLPPSQSHPSASLATLIDVCSHS